MNPYTLHPTSATLNPQPSTLNPQPSTPNPRRKGGVVAEGLLYIGRSDVSAETRTDVWRSCYARRGGHRVRGRV